MYLHAASSHSAGPCTSKHLRQSPAAELFTVQYWPCMLWMKQEVSTCMQIDCGCVEISYFNTSAVHISEKKTWLNLSGCISILIMISI